MYRCLNVETLGISGRQSELIELALSNRFKGLELDLETLARQVDSRGPEYATRCIDSAKKCPAGLHVGPWQLPVNWAAAETKIKEALTRLPALANVAKMVEANACVTNVLAGSETLPLKENFDFYAAKLTEVGELLAPHDIRLGVGFHAAIAAREEAMEHQFISKADELLTLLEMVKGDNVGLYLDTWNWHLGGGTIEMIEKLGVEKIVAVSVADVPAGAAAESVELAQRLFPDPSGVVPHADLLTKLHDLSFEGPVTPMPSMTQYKGVTRDKVVAKAAEALRSVWPGADLLEEAEAEAAESPDQAAGAAAEKKPAAEGEEKKEGDATDNGKKESVATT